MSVLCFLVDVDFEYPLIILVTSFFNAFLLSVILLIHKFGRGPI